MSVHPGGIIITDSPVSDYVPVEKAPKGFPIIQWKKDGTEESGLVKIDLLGNRSLGVIRDAVRNIKENGLSADQIAEFWDMMMSFSGYSFCKPHSASYARVSFQAAYLKTHLPAKFMAAVISNQGGFYSAFA
jgi:DNA polymerase III alpha subunit